MNWKTFDTILLLFWGISFVWALLKINITIEIILFVSLIMFIYYDLKLKIRNLSKEEKQNG